MIADLQLRKEIRAFFGIALNRLTANGGPPEPRSAEELAMRIADGLLCLGLLPHMFGPGKSSVESAEVPFDRREIMEMIASEVYVVLMEHLCAGESPGADYPKSAGRHIYH